VTSFIDRLDARHPVLTKAAAILIAFACLYWADRADQDNTTALHWQMAAQQRSST